MNVKLTDLLTVEVVGELSRQGFEIVRFGECPPWMERIESMPAPVYRMKQMEDY